MRVIAWQDKMMKVSECKTDCHETTERNTGYFAKNIHPSFGWVVFFNPKKQTSRLWQGGKENRCSWHALELYVSKLTAKIHLPVVCFPAKPCSAAWVTTHRPSAHTGTPGIWSSSCYLCLLNTNLHMFSPHWVYIKLQILFFPQCWRFLDMPDTVPGAPCSNRGADDDVPLKASFSDGADENAAKSWRTIVWCDGK